MKQFWEGVQRISLLLGALALVPLLVYPNSNLAVMWYIALAAVTFWSFWQDRVESKRVVRAYAEGIATVCTMPAQLTRPRRVTVDGVIYRVYEEAVISGVRFIADPTVSWTTSRRFVPPDGRALTFSLDSEPKAFPQEDVLRGQVRNSEPALIARHPGEVVQSHCQADVLSDTGHDPKSLLQRFLASVRGWRRGTIRSSGSD